MTKEKEVQNETVVEARFKEGEILPIKGVLFKVALVHQIGIALTSVGLTGRERKRIKERIEKGGNG